MHTSAADLSEWTTELIGRECSRAYRTYERDLIGHYKQYFRAHPALRSSRHEYSASTIDGNLPPGGSDLLGLIPKHSLHRFCRSARSSQMLGLGLLGSAVQSDRSLYWIWSALALPKRLAGLRHPIVRFEHQLSPADLGEIPRTTRLDMSLATEEVFIAFELKLSEPGLGCCSCARQGEGNPNVGFECAQRVYARRKYWDVADRLFGLTPMRTAFERCSMSVAYQAIRTTAAARHFAANRVGVFVLIYDDRNPFFRCTGNWQGWPNVLNSAFCRRPTNRFFFRAIAWQNLIDHLPLVRRVREWAREKHRIG
jgi:hypothetical protein